MNLAKSLSNENENWAARKLGETGLKWKRQATWGCRIFDFWNHEKGIAVEIDGPEHDRKVDAIRDQYNFLRSAIVVIRVKNGDEAGLIEAIKRIVIESSWQERRSAMGLLSKTKKDRLKNIESAGIKRAHGRW